MENPQSDLADVVGVTGLTERQVRGALDELADRAFLRPSRETPGGRRVVSLQVALDLVVHRQEAELARRAQELAASKAAAEAVAAYGELTPNVTVDGAERLVGMDAIEAKLEVLARSAPRRSCCPGC